MDHIRTVLTQKVQQTRPNMDDNIETWHNSSLLMIEIHSNGTTVTCRIVIQALLRKKGTKFLLI